MGGRSNNRGYGGADVVFENAGAALADALRTYIVVALAPVAIGPAWRGLASQVGADGVARANSALYQRAGQNLTDDMKMVTAVDANGDALVEQGEITGWSPHLFRIVPEQLYQHSFAHVSGIITQWEALNLIQSVELLEAFLLGVVPSSANATVVGALQAGEIGYTHHVGALFGSNGVAPVNRYVWNQLSPFADAVAKSDHFSEFLKQGVRNRWADITASWAAGEYGTKTFNNWEIGASGVDFGFFADTDLKLSIGQARLSNASVTFEVEKTEPMQGVPISYVVRRTWFTATIDDTYDFNINALDVFEAVCLQAGFGSLTLSDGSSAAGGIFKTQFNLLNNSGAANFLVGNENGPL
jgi:hypothetical protein